MIPQSLSFAQEALAWLIRGREVKHGLKLTGRWHWDHFRNGRLYRQYDFCNDICNVGKNDLLTTYFYSGTQIATASWCIGLINAAGYTALAAGDTMSSHAGWAEYTTYTQTTRVAWGQGAPASQSVTNGTPAAFNIATGGAGTIEGLFITSNNTKGGTTGILWATALFTAPVPVSVGDQLNGTYTLSC